MSNPISNNIKFLRKQHQLSQCDLAAKIGLNRGNIASYENGTAEPKLENILRIADFFGIGVEDLVGKNLTRLPLQCPTAIEDHTPSAGNSGNELPPTALPESFCAACAISLLTKNARQYRMILDGFHSYHCFKMEGLSLSELPKDLQMIAVNFEGLLEVADAIMAAHEQLLKLIGEHLPQTTEV